MFVGRQQELDFLEEQYASEGGQLVVIYGRRRVGKTELLRHFCQGKQHIFFVARETTDLQQLKLFTEKAIKYAGLNFELDFRGWDDAFRFIVDLPSDAKHLIIFDEFPYAVQNNRTLPSLLQGLWDELLAKKNIMLVLCGSAMSFIEKEILAEKNPLYGRATGIYKVDEFDYKTAAQFFPGYSAIDRVRAYAMLGGIPHYLKRFSDSNSIMENAVSNIFKKGALLYSEVEFLMRQEFRDAAIYNTIIEAVAMGNTKLNDIFNKTGIEKTKLSVYLKNLIELGIVNREYPYAATAKDKVKQQSGLYGIKDNFFRFYYNFLYPNVSDLEQGDAQGVYDYSVKPQLEHFVGYCFEKICRQWLLQQKIQGNLPFRFSGFGRWWHRDVEIDIVASTKSDIIFAECKWTENRVGKAELQKLKEKSFLFGGSFARSYYYLFARSGFTAELVNLAAADEYVRLISVDELFNDA